MKWQIEKLVKDGFLNPIEGMILRWGSFRECWKNMVSCKERKNLVEKIGFLQTNSGEEFLYQETRDVLMIIWGRSINTSNKITSVLFPFKPLSDKERQFDGWSLEKAREELLVRDWLTGRNEKICKGEQFVSVTRGTTLRQEFPFAHSLEESWDKMRYGY